MKKVITFIMSLLLTFTVGYANEPIKVFLDGNRLSFDQPPIIREGRTLVPMRMIFESMGAEVTWNASTQTVTAQTLTVTKEIVTVTLKIGSTTMIKNGEEIILDVPAQIVNERTLVPVRAVAESFGANVEWNDDSQTVIITKSPVPAPTLTYLKLDEEYKTEDGMVVVLKNIDIIQKQSSTQYVIFYELTNGNTDKKLSEGTFKLFLANGTSENQYGFFTDLFPGDTVEREYTFEILNTLTPLLLEYNYDKETSFFRNEPTEKALHWNLNSNGTKTNEVRGKQDTPEEPKELSCNTSLSNSMINVGGSVKIVYSLTANGEGGSGNYKYRFEVLNNGKIISKVDYSTNNSISDTITGTGDFSIKVYVKDDTGQIAESIHSLTD